MVKLLFVGVFYKHDSKIILLKSAADLSSFGFFQKNSVLEFMKFTSKMLIERSELGSRCSLKEQNYMCHCYIKSNRLSSVLISDEEYPNRVAHTFINNVLEEFEKVVPQSKWLTLQENSVAFTYLEPSLAKYQNPLEADALTKIKSELDETMIIVYNTISSLYERGEKLEDLVQKSDELSTQSKFYFATARKTNQCCHYF